MFGSYKSSVSKDHGSKLIESRRQTNVSSLKNYSSQKQISRINSVIKDTIHQTFENSLLGQDQDTLQLLSKHKPKIMSPASRTRNDEGPGMHSDLVYISQKMKEAIFLKGQKDLSRIGLLKYHSLKLL